MKNPACVRRLPIAALLSVFVWSSALAFPLGHDLYIQPTGTGFIENSGETVISVSVSSGLISDAQSQLDSAHASNPNAVVVLTLSGTYNVTSTPLRLSSHTCVVLSPGCVIQAAGSVTATALFEVSSGQTNVSIAGGTFDGGGAALNAIHVITSNRVHIDKVVVRNCGADGIALTGHGNTTFDNELVVTRAEVSGCTGNGISASSGTQTVCSDDYCHNNGAAGIYLATAHSTVVNNRCVANATGIVAHGSASSVTDNTVDSNGTGIALDSSSNANLCTSNVITNSTTVALSDAGTNDILFQNSLSGNASNLAATGTGADIIAWRGSLSASGQNYFYPPLIDDQHTAAIESGKSRTDVTIGSASLATVQTQYNNARSAHPNDVIVLHLTGSTYTGSSSLTLSSDTCILLSGTINLSSGVTAFVASGQSRICISGGTIDGGGNTTAMAVSLSAGCAMVQLDSMTIRNFGPLTPRSSGGVVENSKGATPFIVSRCTLNGGSARGLWVISGPFTVICTDTTSENFNMDGIDLDSHTIGSLVKFCTCSGNFRCGIFVEQSAYYNQLIGNVLTGNYRCGVSVWNNGLSGAETPGTNWNSLICNDASSNLAQSSSGYGIETGCQPGATNQQYTAHNFYFNNDVMNNQGAGIEDANLGQGPNGTTQDVENFFCQNIVSGNSPDYQLSPNGGEKFFNPRVPALSVAAPSFSPAGGTYNSAQSVTISTTTTGASIRYTTDGSTPSETAGTLYTGPVTVAASETLKAIAYESGYTDSSVSSAAYTIAANSVMVTVATGFYNQPLSSAQTGTFTATWDASASLSPSNSLVGLSQGNATAYTNIAVAVRFNPSGDIDARNGGAYAALSTIPYTANTTYHFRVVVNVPAHTYSAYVTPPGGSEITIGTDYAFRTEAAGDTQLDTWNADVNTTPGGSMTVSNFTVATAQTYTLTASADANGSISPSGAVTVNQGASQTFTITPNSGYLISDVSVDGASVGAVSSYTFSNVQANHTISSSFAAIPTYTITTSAGVGGTITPAGSVTVTQGANQAFTIAASSGYSISDVAVDGTSVGAVSSYTFSNVQANHTISASFAALPTYSITASAGIGGTISPSGAVSVTQGANQTFAIAANSGFVIADVSVDGTSVGAVASYMFGNVQANHTIAASFSASTALPAGWADVDIGAPAMAGSATYSSGTFSVTGGGTDIWNTSDQFNYAYETTSGNMTITALVATQQNTAPWAKSGVMFRGSTAANDVFVDVFVSPTNGIAMQYRTAVGGTCTSIAGATAVVAPYWVRIVHSGTTFTGYSSPDGATWTQVGSVTISMATAATAGLEVCSHTATALNTSTFQNVTITTTVADSNIAPSGTAYGWFGMTSSTATTNQTAKPGLNDNNLTTDVDLDSAGDAIGAWEAAGVIWSSAKTISSADFINGTVTTGGDGFLTANLTLQYTTNGTTWTNTGWTISPTYPYSSAASGQTYTASGTALSGVLGMRYVGQVRSTDTSYHWIVKEVQLTGH